MEAFSLAEIMLEERNDLDAGNLAEKTDALEAKLLHHLESELSFYSCQDPSAVRKAYFQAKHHWFETWSRAYIERLEFRAFLDCLFQYQGLLSTAMSFFDCETMEKFWKIGAGNLRRYEWHSIDLSVGDKKLSGVLRSRHRWEANAVLPLKCEFFESQPYLPKVPRDYLSEFYNQRHGEAQYNKLVMYRVAKRPSDGRWSRTRTQYAYPYVGKITNGSLSVHPPNNPGFVTIKIQLRENGLYMIPELGVRRIYLDNGTVRFAAFPGEWKAEACGLKKGKIEGVYFGHLKKDDEIFVAVDWGKERNYGCDMCEVDFTLLCYAC